MTHNEQTGPMVGQLFGLTHNTDGSMIVRKSKLLKVGIGIPKGPALNVWTQRQPDGSVVWKLMLGFKEGATKTATLKTRAEAEAKFNEAYSTAPICKYPRKIGYFTFTKPVMVADVERYLPDFDAIEAYGPTPTEIDVVFMDDSPFTGAYQMWSSSELRCKGDGITANRLVTLATADEKATFVTEGEKWFTPEKCWTTGCQYATGEPTLCKPGGDLTFQLASSIRIGGTAFFHTTGFRSISTIFNSLTDIALLTGGRLRGLPVKMCLRPFKTNHNGQVATQFAVSLEFRAPDATTLRKKLLESVFDVQDAAFGPLEIAAPVAPESRQIAAPSVVDALPVEDDDDEPPMAAEAMANEFYPEADEAPVAEATVPQAATATKADSLKDRLAAQVSAAREKGTAVDAVATKTIHVPPTPDFQSHPMSFPVAGKNEKDLF